MASTKGNHTNPSGFAGLRFGFLVPGFWLGLLLIVLIYDPAATRNLDQPLTSESTMIEVQRDRLELIPNEGTMYYGDTLFTGYGVTYYEGGQLAERTAFVDGKREGVTERWYSSGSLSFRATYKQNRRDGTARTWWQDGTLRSESNYANGVAHGVQRQWYQSGARFKELNLEQGQEAGLQRAWRENGKLYANYEAIDGRIYGLKRANLCYDLDGESIQLTIK